LRPSSRSPRRPSRRGAGLTCRPPTRRWPRRSRATTRPSARAPQALERTRSNRAHLYEQRGNIAETEYRSKEAAEFYLAAAKDTPAADLESTRGGLRSPAAALFVHGRHFFANDTLREAIRILESEALRRYEQIVPGSDEQRRLVAASTAIVLANIADAQTSLGGRLPGYDGAKMMVDARATYRKALDRIKVEEFPDLAMDILNRRRSAISSSGAAS
jgi:hypothetical protein